MWPVCLKKAHPCRLSHASVHQLENVFKEVVDKLGEILVVGVRAESVTAGPVHLELLVEAALPHHPLPGLLVPATRGTLLKRPCHQNFILRWASKIQF
jgi:hypothetical protein